MMRKSRKFGTGGPSKVERRQIQDGRQICVENVAELLGRVCHQDT